MQPGTKVTSRFGPNQKWPVVSHIAGLRLDSGRFSCQESTEAGIKVYEGSNFDGHNERIKRGGYRRGRVS